MLGRDWTLGVLAVCCAVTSGVALAGDKAVSPAKKQVNPVEEAIAFDTPIRRGLAVGSSLDTIFADEAPQPEASPIITLRAARRESESAPIA